MLNRSELHVQKKTISILRFPLRPAGHPWFRYPGCVSQRGRQWATRKTGSL